MTGKSEETLFIEALELPEKERAAYLDKHCQGNADLRARLEKMIVASASSDSYIEQLERVDDPETVAWREQAETLQGQKIGPYKLLQKIGEGGFGVVYMAEQDAPIRRKVAIKIVKPGMDSQAVIARFEAERQALAMMDHPNIAQVFDGGAIEDSDVLGGLSRPYFVMELVKGVPITEYCDANCLETRERLRLFQSVCFAVQHAHQKGIIHRDIKPSNVMVTLHDGKPMVKVIDFGVAKAISQRLTEKTMFTEFGQMIGTPQYMSPEQAEMSGLDVDTRSDVYSLGVLLYELLTGTTPIESRLLREAGYVEMQRMIREEDPPLPSARLSTCGEELTVIAKHRNVTPQKLNHDVRGDLDWIVMRALDKDRNRRYETAVDFARDIECSLKNETIAARKPSMLYKFRKLWLRNQARFTIGILASALLVSGLVFWWYVAVNQENQARQRKQRSAEKQQRIDEQSRKFENALVEAQTRLEAAKQSSVNDPLPWELADASLDHMDSLVTDELNHELLQRRLKLTADHAMATADRGLAEAIEFLVIDFATHEDRSSWAGMEEGFRTLFQRHGIDFSKQTPAEVAALIDAHPLEKRLEDALELWIATKGHLSQIGGAAATAKSMQPMADALLAADQDPLRTAIRKLLYEMPTPAQRNDPAAQKAYQEVIDNFKAVSKDVDLEKLSVRSLSWLSTGHALVGQHQQSKNVYQFALTRNPDDVMLNVDYALQLRYQKKWEKAARYYMRCTAMRPRVGGIWRSLGVALREAGDYEEARETLIYTTELQPNHAPTLIDLAETYLLEQDFQNAERQSRNAIQSDENYAEAYGCLGRSLMQQKQYAAALIQLNKCKAMVDANPRLKIPIQEWIDQCNALKNQEASGRLY